MPTLLWKNYESVWGSFVPRISDKPLFSPILPIYTDFHQFRHFQQSPQLHHFHHLQLQNGEISETGKSGKIGESCEIGENWWKKAVRWIKLSV